MYEQMHTQMYITYYKFLTNQFLLQCFLNLLKISAISEMTKQCLYALQIQIVPILH